MMATAAFAQRPAPAASAAAPTTPPAPQAQPAQPAQPQLPAWESFPQMLIERVYRGPQKDTVIQRLRDPIDGTVCYVYLPIAVSYQPVPGAYVQYGGNSVGTISCVHPSEVIQMYQHPPSPAPAGTQKTR